MAGVPAPRTQPRKHPCIPAAAKSVWIVQGQNVGHAISVPTPFTCFSRATSGRTSLATCSIRRSYSAMRWLSEFDFSQQRIQGVSQLLAQTLGAFSIHCSVPRFFNRSPYDFINPRAAFTSA